MGERGRLLLVVRHVRRLNGPRGVAGIRIIFSKDKGKEIQNYANYFNDMKFRNKTKSIKN